MNAEFSFNYGEKFYKFAAENSAVYELEKGVTVSVVRKEYQAYDAVEWVLYFENTSDTNSQIISEISDCDTLLPFGTFTVPRSGYKTEKGNACVITMNGAVEGRYYWENDKVSATEFNFNYEYLDRAPGKTRQFANINARSSDGMMPFFDVTANGSGYITAIGWTGDWKAEFSKKEDGIHMKSGLKTTCFYLKPGEKIRTSSTLIMQYGAEEEKHNKFRRLIKNYISHLSNTGATREGLMANELWGGMTSEEMKKRINELKAHHIAFEEIWIDAGWYGQCQKCDDAFTGDWYAHTGEWEVNKRVHPEGLKDVAACAKEGGMHLMLWVEPERARVGTMVLEEHPEWFTQIPNSGDYILDYGNEEAFAYAFHMLSNHITELELSCYRQDFNTGLTALFEAKDEENRRGISEIKHITGMYALWDKLLEAHPGLLIDNCSGGGRRIDIETLKRSIPFFRSDYQCNFNENPEVLQVHNSNISCYLPFNGCTSKTKSDTYAIRSSYSSSWGGAFYNAIFQSMDEADFVWARKVTEEYRRIRRYFSMDFYNHGSCTFDDTAWAIWQYHDAETGSGIVMAFRRSASPFEQVHIKLKGLEGNMTYRYENLDTNEIFEASDSISIHLPEKRSSVILGYNLK